jgi:hypothetical protein
VRCYHSVGSDPDEKSASSPTANGSYEEQLYLIYDQPKAPQTIPWIGVLDDVCKWADIKNDNYLVRGFITLDFYNSGYIEYQNIAIVK